MKSARRNGLVVACIAVALTLQGCGPAAQIIKDMTPTLNGLIETGCKSAVATIFAALQTKAAEKIASVCQSLSGVALESCTKVATTNVTSEVETQKTNQTAACVAKMKTMFNTSSWDLTAISTAAANFEWGEKVFDTAWLQSKIDAINGSWGLGPGATAATTGRLYASAPQQASNTIKDSSSPMYLLSLVAATTMLVGLAALGAKRLSASRRAESEAGALEAGAGLE